MWLVTGVLELVYDQQGMVPLILTQMLEQRQSRKRKKERKKKRRRKKLVTTENGSLTDEKPGTFCDHTS